MNSVQKVFALFLQFFCKSRFCGNEQLKEKGTAAVWRAAYKQGKAGAGSVRRGCRQSRSQRVAWTAGVTAGEAGQ